MPYEFQQETLLDPSDLKAATDSYLTKVKHTMEEADIFDREEDRKKRRAKKLDKKIKLKERTKRDTAQVCLALAFFSFSLLIFASV